MCFCKVLVQIALYERRVGNYLTKCNWSIIDIITTMWKPIPSPTLPEEINKYIINKYTIYWPGRSV